jgi:Sortase domain
VLIKLLNVLVVVLIAGGAAVAITGRHTLRWAPPPLPPTWEAPAQIAYRPLPVSPARLAGHPRAEVPAADAGPARQAGVASARSADAGPARQAGVAPARSADAGPARQAGAARAGAAQAGAAQAGTAAARQAPARPAAPAARPPAAVPMARSVPVSLDIPAIGVRAEIIALGLRGGGSMATPPLTRPFLAGWYDLGPTPGQRGAAVIAGHVDAASVGPAVFYHLGDLRPGQLIYVTLADGRTAVFAVSAAALYPKADFPATTVFGYTKDPSLRLITCGGVFDPQTGHYLSNIVVFASYVGST